MSFDGQELMVEEITEIKTESQLKESLEVIRVSFGTVARELNLTQENCPSHASFTTMEKLIELQKKAKFFGLYATGMQIGFVAVEQAEGGIYYMDRLAVLPVCRHFGYGKTLVRFVLDYVNKLDGVKVSLGMIDNHTILKEWYKSLGFNETGAKKFEHLPFTVCFMEKNLLS